MMLAWVLLAYQRGTVLIGNRCIFQPWFIEPLAEVYQNKDLTGDHRDHFIEHRYRTVVGVGEEGE